VGKLCFDSQSYLIFEEQAIVKYNTSSLEKEMNLNLTIETKL
jgi:hypothetical protein